MTKACAYSRVSGVAQIDGDGFERQRLAIEAYAAAHDIEIARWYEEKAISGKTEWESRPAWLDLIEGLDGVRIIVIERLDRLARRLMSQENIIADLCKRGVTLISCAEPDLDSTDPTRVLMRQIFGCIAEWERAQIVLKLRGARQRMKKKTGRCEGQKPYGFYPGEADILAEIMELGEKATPTAVAGELNQRGRVGRGGKPWHRNVVARILRKSA
jgi:DNA invertase Pin-like site-specific DNA recombinase